MSTCVTLLGVHIRHLNWLMEFFLVGGRTLMTKDDTNENAAELSEVETRGGNMRNENDIECVAGLVERVRWKVVDDDGVI